MSFTRVASWSSEWAIAAARHAAGAGGEGALPLLPTFHPNFLLHTPSASVKRTVWEDFLLLMEKLGLPISEKQRAFFATK